jgi:nicotinamidase-related amidase
MMRDFEDHCWKDVVTPDILEIYKAYHRKIYVGDKPALLAIDLYNLAYEGGARPVTEVIKECPSSSGENAWNAIRPTQRLFQAARAAGLPVIYSTAETRKDAVTGTVKATNRQVNRVVSDSYDIKEEFLPEPGDLVIHKERASAFFGTPLIAHLTLRGVHSLIVCGQSTSGCVRASVVDAYSCGFHTTVVEECCFDRSILSHKINLFDMHHKYADVIHVDEVVAHLDRKFKKQEVI